jgi:hypothetical protein
VRTGANYSPRALRFLTLPLRLVHHLAGHRLFNVGFIAMIIYPCAGPDAAPRGSA